jgi:hypothetical protein
VITCWVVVQSDAVEVDWVVADVWRGSLHASISGRCCRSVFGRSFWWLTLLSISASGDAAPMSFVPDIKLRWDSSLFDVFPSKRSDRVRFRFAAANRWFRRCFVPLTSVVGHSSFSEFSTGSGRFVLFAATILRMYGWRGRLCDRLYCVIVNDVPLTRFTFFHSVVSIR